MVMGGVEKELLTILKKFDQSEYEIEVLLFYESDHNITKHIPHGVKLTILDSDRNYWFGNLKKTVMTRLARGHFCEAFLVAGKTAFSGGACSAHIRLDGIEAPMCEYDVAVCYHMHGSIRKASEYKRHHNDVSITLIHNTVNIGVSASRNKALEMSRGKYIWFVDADDMINPQSVTALIHAVKAEKAEAAFGDYQLVHEKAECRNYAPGSYKLITNSYDDSEFINLWPHCDGKIMKSVWGGYIENPS